MNIDKSVQSHKMLCLKEVTTLNRANTNKFSMDRNLQVCISNIVVGHVSNKLTSRIGINRRPGCVYVLVQAKIELFINQHLA